MIAPVILSLTSLAALLLAQTYGLWSFGTPGAGLMPAAAAALLLCASVTDIRITPIRIRIASGSVRALCYIAGLILLAAFTPLTGMLMALAVFIVAILHFVEGLGIMRAIAIAGSVVAGSWLLFEKLLSVPLPKSLLL